MTANILRAAVLDLGTAALILNLGLFALTELLKATTRGWSHRARVGLTEESAAAFGEDAPFISIHVPCCNEPPQVLAETLSHLSRLDYPSFEVIVLDNNTPDAKTWQPVAEICRKLGPRFRFFHVARLAGAKAGALNQCLSHTDARAAYIAVVDADYQVARNFLGEAVRILRASRAAFVQFPQAFRNAAGASAAVSLELEDYFSVLARQAPRVQTPLLTGTLSVISIEALNKVGGWSAQSVTEDAELGVRLFACGERGVFSDEIVGRGLLPTSLEGLKKQRRRWIAGNMQTFLRALRTGVLSRRPGVSSVLTQLAAWPAFWLAPIAVLVLAAPWAARDAAMMRLTALASATLLSACVFSVMRAILDRNPRASIRRGVGGPLLVKLALIWVSSTAWLDAAYRRTIPFVRTSKVAARSGSTGANAAAALLSLGAGVLYASHDDIPAVAACLLAALSWPAAIWVDRGLMRYGRANGAAAGAAPEMPSLRCTV